MLMILRPRQRLLAWAVPPRNLPASPQRRSIHVSSGALKSASGTRVSIKAKKGKLSKRSKKVLSAKDKAIKSLQQIMANLETKQAEKERQTAVRLAPTQQQSTKPSSVQALSWETHGITGVFDELKQKLKITNNYEWYYKLTRNTLKSIKFGKLALESCGDTLSGCLNAAYPDHHWVEWQFKRQEAPFGFWVNMAQHKAFFEWFMIHRNMNSLEEWYSVPVKEIRAAGARTMLKRYYADSMRIFLGVVEPNHKWLPWRFPTITEGFWDDISHQRQFVTWVEKVLNIRTKSGWFHVSRADLDDLGGSGLLRKHGSILGILRQVYPDHEWPEWLVGAPRGFWNSTENQKRFFDWTYTHLNFKSMDDWYTVTQTQLNELGGRTSGLLKHYDGSFKDALKALYPNHTWEDAAFDTPTKKAWDELTTSVQLMDRLKAQFKIENLEEWYNIGTSDIKKAFGKQVPFHMIDLISSLRSMYPDHEWLEWKFQTVPPSFWSDTDNQARFIHWLEKKLDIDSLEKWYTVPRKTIKDLGGHTLMNRFSVVELLRGIYPHHQWLEWYFPTVPPNFWSSPANQKRFIEWAAGELDVKTLSDWYMVSTVELAKLRGLTLLTMNSGSLYKLLLNIYPEHSWISYKFASLYASKKQEKEKPTSSSYPSAQRGKEKEM